jgi:hypothetical protein
MASIEIISVPEEIKVVKEKPKFEISYIPNIFKANERHNFQIEIPDETINYSKLEDIILENLNKSLIENSLEMVKVTKDQMVIFMNTYMLRTDTVFETKDLKDMKLYLFKNERNPLLVEGTIDTSSIMTAFNQLLGNNFNVTPTQHGNTMYFTIPLTQGQNPTELLSAFQSQLSSLMNVPIESNIINTNPMATLATLMGGNTAELPQEVRNIDLFNSQSRIQEEAFVRYETQLKELHTLGFIDDAVNLEALILNDGNLETSLEFILNSMG